MVHGGSVYCSASRDGFGEYGKIGRSAAPENYCYKAKETNCETDSGMTKTTCWSSEQ